MVTFLDNKARYKLISGLPTKESVTGEIQLPEDDPVAVEKMIQYMYTLDYSPAEKGDEKAKAADAHDDKTSIRSSNPEEAKESNSRKCEEAHPNQPAESLAGTSRRSESLFLHIRVYALAHCLLIPGLKTLARRYFYESLRQHLDSDTFGLAIQDVYCSTPYEDRGLRDLVIKVALDNLRTLTSTGVLSSSLLRKVPDFASDLSMAMMSMMSKDVPPTSQWSH